MLKHHTKSGYSSISHSIKLWGQRSLLLWLAYAVRIITLDTQGLWRDEVDQWRFALAPLHEMIQNFTRPGWNGPLFSPMLRGWIALTGESAFAMRYFSLLWGVLSVALIYILGRRLLNENGAVWWSAFLVTLSPYLVWYAQEVKMYTWVPMLALLALYALERACITPHPRWWVIVLGATTLAFYSHILAALLIPVEFLWFWLHPRRHPKAWKGGGGVLAMLTLPYLPLVRWQTRLLLEMRETGFPHYTLGQMVTTLTNGWSTGINVSGLFWERVTLTAIIIFAGLAITGGINLLRRHRWHILARLGCWLCIPVLLIWIASMRGPIFTDRYLIWAAPAFYLLAGTGLSFLQRLEYKLAPLLLATLLGLNGAGLYKQAQYPIKPQFEAAMIYLESHRDPQEPLLFQIPYNQHVLRYYYGNRVMEPWAEAPFTNWRLPDGGYQVGMDYVNDEMTRILQPYPDSVWLIYSEFTLWDERALVKGWLDQHYRLADEVHFQGVSLYQYLGNDG